MKKYYTDQVPSVWPFQTKNPQEMIQMLLKDMEERSKEFNFAKNQDVESIGMKISIDPIYEIDTDNNTKKILSDKAVIHFLNIEDIQYSDKAFTQQIYSMKQNIKDKYNKKMKEAFHEGDFEKWEKLIQSRLEEEKRSIPDFRTPITNYVYLGSYQALKTELEKHGFSNMPKDCNVLIENNGETSYASIVYYPARNIRMQKQMTPEEKLLRSFFENNESTPQEPENNGKKI